MKRITTILALALAVAVPAAATASQPTRTEKQAAKAQCKALLKAEGTSNFTHAWGAKGKGRAYGKCVSSVSKQKAAEAKAAHSNAAKDCKAEQAQSDADFSAAHNGQTFSQVYGGKNAKSAYGKCVSTKAKQNQKAADEKDANTVNAAKACRSEQKQDAATFKTNYKNFGQCVSKKAHELNAQRQQDQTQTQTQS